MQKGYALLTHLDSKDNIIKKNKRSFLGKGDSMSIVKCQGLLHTFNFYNGLGMTEGPRLSRKSESYL